MEQTLVSMNTMNQIGHDRETCRLAAEHPRRATEARPGSKTLGASILVAGLFLGVVAPSHAAVTLIQKLLNSASTQAYGTNGVNITTNPVSQTVSPGASVTLSVGATGSNLQYEWMINGYVVPGATNAVLTVNNISPGNCGAYNVLVYNNLDKIPSDVVYVQESVATLPFADNFTNRVAITGTNGIGCGTSVGATREASDPTPATGWMFHTLWITWVAPATGPVEFNTDGSGYDTWLGVYTGSVPTNLVTVATDDDSGDFDTSYLEFNAQAGTAYQIMIGDRDFRGAPLMFSWNEVPSVNPLPTIVSSPTNITTTFGSSASMSVQFQSTLPTTIQWYHNGQLMAGASQNSLQWTQLALTDLGTYQAVLTSSQWVYPLPPVEIQFNSEGLSTVAARPKLSDAVTSGLIGQ